MWLVHDYVVDVLKVKDTGGLRLPKLMYVRTQETDVQRREYETDFKDFGNFFSHVLERHEDAQILTQMFAPGGVHGHALPVWTAEDLDSYEGSRFWTQAHGSQFKDAVDVLRSKLVPQGCVESAGNPQEAETPADGPPLMALASLEQHLPRIARLEAFDPRDHEAAK
ncbi:unnamed protein product, partial [Polarella glacialis]